MLLAALRIEDGKNNDLDVTFDVGKRLFQRCNGFGLVRLDRDAHRRSIQNLAHDLNASTDAVRMLQHHAEVRRKIRFAFRTVQDEIFAMLVRRRIELHGRRKPCASHAADSGILNAL